VLSDPAVVGSLMGMADAPTDSEGKVDPA
jgi:hypothetical protein